jgi:hypothetical protein
LTADDIADTSRGNDIIASTSRLRAGKSGVIPSPSTCDEKKEFISENEMSTVIRR